MKLTKDQEFKLRATLLIIILMLGAGAVGFSFASDINASNEHVLEWQLNQSKAQTKQCEALNTIWKNEVLNQTWTIKGDGQQ